MTWRCALTQGMQCWCDGMVRCCVCCVMHGMHLPLPRLLRNARQVAKLLCAEQTRRGLWPRRYAARPERLLWIAAGVRTLCFATACPRPSPAVPQAQCLNAHACGERPHGGLHLSSCWQSRWRCSYCPCFSEGSVSVCGCRSCERSLLWSVPRNQTVSPRCRNDCTHGDATCRRDTPHAERQSAHHAEECAAVLRNRQTVTVLTS